MLTYILPSAGQGSRLGLPYPKEIHRVLPNSSLIDFSLKHLVENMDAIESVIIVIAPGKEIVVDYVQRERLNSSLVNGIYFNELYSEWPGSIRSAEKYFGKFNIVLLPDSVLTTKRKEKLSEKFIQEFEAGADLVFAYVEEIDRNKLIKLGALNIVGSNVIDFCDKPHSEDPRKFNAFWGAFGFKGECGSKILELMGKSVERKEVDLSSLNLKISAFPLDTYKDLGTWPSIANFLSAKNLIQRF